MSLINPRLIDQCDQTAILSEIDKKLQLWAKNLSDNMDYGFDNKINYVSFESLTLLRDIFVDKLNCADWLDRYDMRQIILAIRKYTKQTC